MSITLLYTFVLNTSIIACGKQTRTSFCNKIIHIGSYYSVEQYNMSIGLFKYKKLKKNSELVQLSTLLGIDITILNT